jgi:hypothetical protein
MVVLHTMITQAVAVAQGLSAVQVYLPHWPEPEVTALPLPYQALP